MSDRVPDGVYVYQPHPVSRKDGLLWNIGGLPSGMTREQAAALAEAANRILANKPEGQRPC
jgi:hypothetical protein